VLKLYRDHLGINLNDCSVQPIAYTISLLIVIAENLDVIPNFEGIISIGCGSEV